MFKNITLFFNPTRIDLIPKHWKYMTYKNEASEDAYSFLGFRLEINHFKPQEPTK